LSSDTKGQIQLLLQGNRVADALKLCKSLCKRSKKDAEAWFLLGNAYAQTGRLDDAIGCLRRSISLNDRIAITHNNLGLIYLHAKRFKHARDCFQNALRLKPDSVATLFNLGNALRATQQLDEAQAAYQSALQLQPDLSGVINNLGITLYEKGELKEAERCLLRSLELAPEQSDAYINITKCYREQRNVTGAENALRTAVGIYPAKPEIHWELSLVLLELGKFDEGWKEYEWRLQGGGLMIRDFPIPTWRGEDISHKSILVSAEQGIGDEIMFASCFPDLIRCAQRVVIDCEPRLAPLFARSFPTAIVHSSKQTESISWVQKAKDLDVHISAGSLPGYFRKSMQAFPEHKGYLVAEIDLVKAWRRRYKEIGPGIKIGISWKGGHISQAKRRSTAIEDWGPILKSPGIDFINLQYGEVDADIEKARLMHGATIHHWQDSDPLANMDQFAAQIAALDLVISIDNSTVHLAGALGIPAWVLQPFCPDWRWMQQSASSYWYPSVRQFHPDTRGDWEAEINYLAGELAAYLSAGSI